MKCLDKKEREEVASYFKDILGDSYSVFVIGNPSFTSCNLWTIEGKTDFYIFESKRTYKRTRKKVIEDIYSKNKKIFKKGKILYIGAIGEEQIATLNGSMYRFIIQFACF